MPQSETPEAPFLIEAPFLVIINRRSAAVKICRKFHESNFENVRDLYFDTLLNRSNFHQSERRNSLANRQRV